MAWPSPSQTDLWWRRFPKVSWTASTTPRWRQTLTTWMVTAKPTKWDRGLQARPDCMQGNALGSFQGPELIARRLPYLHSYNIRKTSAKLFEAQSHCNFNQPRGKLLASLCKSGTEEKWLLSYEFGFALDFVHVCYFYSLSFFISILTLLNSW